MHKYVVEQLLYSATACYGLKTSALRVFSAYGAGLKRQIFHDVARKIDIAKSEGKTAIQLFGTGLESRDFIHAVDVARAAVAVSSRSSEGFEVFNVASGIEVTIRDAVETFFEVNNISIGVNFTGSMRAGDPHRWQADISKIHQIGFNPISNFKTELQNYQRWLKGIEAVQ
jgi:UDP-glucose 4-epimerase